MMIRKGPLILLVLLFLAGFVFSQAAYTVLIHPSSKLFSSTEPLTGYIQIANHSPVASHDTRLILQLVPRDAKGPYNAVMEEIIPIGLVNASSSQQFPFTLSPSESVPSGPYTLYTYVYAYGLEEIGTPFIFLTPIKEDVFLKGDQNALFQFDRILLNNAPNQFGPTVAPGSSIQLSLSTRHFAPASKTISIRVRSCPWSDLDCLDESSFLTDETKTVTLSSESPTQTVSFSWTAPTIPGAYAVRIEALDGDQLIRLDRSRFVVSGENGKIQGFYSTQPFLLENQLVEFHARVTSFADQTSGLSAGRLRFTLSANGVSLLSEEKPITISSINDPIVTEKLSFTPSKNEEQATACMELFNGDQLLDQECIHFRSADFTAQNQLLEKFPLSLTLDRLENQLTIQYAGINAPNYSVTVTDPAFQEVEFKITGNNQYVAILARPADYYTQKVVDLSNGTFASRRYYVSDANIINEPVPVVPNQQPLLDAIGPYGAVLALVIIVVLLVGGIAFYRRIIKTPQRGRK